MKKFISMVMMTIMMMVCTVSNAQTQSNYASSSKFTDNVSVTLQGGVVTPFSHCFNKSYTDATIVVGVDKYITPVFGVGVEGRTAIATGKIANSHTAFDAINLSGYAKMNLANLVSFDGYRHLFEPVPYVGIGWLHNTCSHTSSISANYSLLNIPTERLGTQMRNSMTCRAGVELNFNLGEERDWAIVVNPSVVWGNVDNMRLCKSNGNFELTAGLVYHFKTSNGTNTFAKAVLYDEAEIARLNGIIADLKNQPKQHPHKPEPKVVKEVVHDVVYIFPKINFEKNSSEISTTALANVKVIADYIKSSDKSYNVIGYASTEGDENRNLSLSQLRADAIKNALIDAGVPSSKLTAIGKGVTKQFGNEYENNRIVIVENK